ncbi:MAG: 4-hydroxythreonine-4-phosphate dehydrogenase PdxA [Rhodobacteraceae bacterium]|nr:4-hydroxythreonine-4-phosphate dehydrogenase PdxA [Paracoccaceae bacterium]
MNAPVALCCGEPAGIGPEIAVQAWDKLRDDCPFVWIGDPRHLPAGTPVELIDDLGRVASASARALPVMVHEFAGTAVPGRPDPANARGVIEVIRRGVDLVQSGAARALCTAPINKLALIEGAGFAYPGHTEYLGALVGAPRAVMMLVSPELRPQLRVVPATIHIPLSEVPGALTPALLRQTIAITVTGLRNYFGISHPRIAVAGLNPHAGEGGAMGQEELDWIAPLLSSLNEDFTIEGPLPADTMFHAAARQRYDVAIAMYHDQALIPIKTLDFDRGVNVTLGLPFLRTSPDHGTAFDIAGLGRANPSSLIEALKLAHEAGAIRTRF